MFSNLASVVCGVVGLFGMVRSAAVDISKRQVNYYVNFADDYNGGDVKMWPTMHCQNMPDIWNDRATHVWVNYCATVYEHSNCQGKFRTFCGQQRHDLGDMRGIVSSVNNLNHLGAAQVQEEQMCCRSCPRGFDCYIQCPNQFQCIIESFGLRLLCRGAGRILDTVCYQVGSNVGYPSCGDTCTCAKSIRASKDAELEGAALAELGNGPPRSRLLELLRLSRKTNTGLDFRNGNEWSFGVLAGLES
ncbi:hypothetical protein HK102_013782 [Quaeritorhiza haematococci]|nr:hypothetical protein HK102_013782 [Quaeritorhiza haematococci]